MAYPLGLKLFEYYAIVLTALQNNLLEDFLGKMAAEMETHPIWTGIAFSVLLYIYNFVCRSLFIFLKMVALQ